MSYMQWSSDYEMGIALIDSDHKKLVSLINQLYDAMSKGEGEQAMGQVLQGLVEYCATHFANEEKLMTQYDYPDYKEHKRIHDGLTAKAKSLLEEHQSGRANMSIGVVKFLKDWLNKHILETDRRYRRFFLDKGVK